MWNAKGLENVFLADVEISLLSFQITATDCLPVNNIKLFVLVAHKSNCITMEYEMQVCAYCKPFGL